MSVDAAHEAEFNEWHDSEHIPALAAVPGCLAARRYRATAEGSPRYVALYHLETPEVQASPEWARAANAPWTDRIRHHFRDRLRIAARRYTRER